MECNNLPGVGNAFIESEAVNCFAERLRNSLNPSVVVPRLKNKLVRIFSYTRSLVVKF